MEFRLVYQGSLPSATASNPKPKEQQRIRKVFHHQLKEYWRTHPQLKQFMDGSWLNGTSVIDRVSRDYMRGPHRFMPLAKMKTDSFCSLDITFLRRDFPGTIVMQGGDLDNRLKTLLDALRIPDSLNGLSATVEEEYDPMFVLLQDDAQITKLTVVTDRLLAPLNEGEMQHDVVLIINVHLYIGTNVTQVVHNPGSA